MNLLKNRKENNWFDYINPISIRQYQYNFLLDFCENAINFLAQQKNNYLQVSNKTLHQRINYKGVYNSSFSKVSIDVKNINENRIYHFTDFFVPTLIENNHFYLNGCYYTPILYLVDYPIITKQNSSKIFGLFNSITLYNRDDIAIFVRHNLPLDYFLQLFIDFEDDIYQEYIKKYGLKHKKRSQDNIIEILSNRFSVKEKTVDAIINKFETLFFDDYTYELYRRCYNLDDFNLKDIIRITLTNANKDPVNFVDLRYKRVSFLEMILRPFLDRISNLAIEVSKGIEKNNMKVDDLFILKYFLTSNQSNSASNKQMVGLSGNYLYDTKNLYSSILINKCSFITPGMSMPPNEVKHLHKTHFGKICPITISAQTPGETISLIPDIQFDEFGIISNINN
jgi:DNA-directed RNA polymerase beta subunit